MQTRFALGSIFLATVLLSCTSTKPPNSVERPTVYTNGDIVTMATEEIEYVEAVVEIGGKIVFAGPRQAAQSQFPEANQFDLQGQTMFPGFIEPHAHPVSIGAMILANDIVAPHEWRMPKKTFKGVTGKENYLEAVADIIKSKSNKDETVLIWGYHKSWHGTLTLDDLDAATDGTPTIIWQRSTHEVYLNSAAAEKYSIAEGDLQETEQVDWTNLHFWERAYQEIKGTKLKPFFSDTTILERGMSTMSSMMKQNGLIAMAEPSFPNSDFGSEYRALVKETENAQSYGIYLIPGFPEQFVMGASNEDYKKRIEDFPEHNTDHITFLTNQYKTFADGAIYSLALQLTDGFFGCAHCHAEWIIPLQEGEELFTYWWDQGYKIHVHITGDLAFEKYLDFTERAMKRNPRENHRTTFHHIGYFTQQQAERAANLGIEASANPYYLWALADKYSEEGFGPERAENMVALKALTDNDIPLSLHSDFAMAPAEPLLLAWVAANRIVASGKVMREDQKISIYKAFQGVTITAARTFEMDHRLGSIADGKEASFTILTQNPFKIDPANIKDIPISAVVYKGRYLPN